MFEALMLFAWFVVAVLIYQAVGLVVLLMACRVERAEPWQFVNTRSGEVHDE